MKARVEVTPALEAQWLAEGKAAWPELDADDTFRARLAATASAQGGVFEGFCAADFYLVSAFAKGEPTAIETLVDRIRSAVVKSAGNRHSASEKDEAAGDLRMELLVAQPGRVPSILTYQGRGPLDGFLSVAATRKLIALRRGATPAPQSDEDAIFGSTGEGTSDVAELRVMKERYGAQVSACFSAALRNLPPERRLLLRQHYLDQLSLEAVARVHGVHRATAARWLADARAALLEAVRDGISQALGLQRMEVDSMVRAVESRLDLSARMFLSREG